MEHEDDCGRGEDAHEVSVNIEFELKKDSDGDVTVAGAGIRSHIHNVPVEAAIGTLLIAAHKMLADHMAHENFEGCLNHEIAHAMGRAAASAYMIELIKTMPEAVEVEVVIPDDIRELMGD